jgi:PLP dependent protein
MSLAERYQAVMNRIGRAADRAGRAPEAITLVAVTKTWSAEVVAAAYEVGMRHFGENRPEELAVKRPEVAALLGSPADITWHLIGPLQSRKTNLAVETADVFHALDRLKIARRLSQRLAEAGNIALPVFLEVNVSGEASKAGFDCREWEENVSQRQMLQAAAEAVSVLPCLRPVGLMTMAPWEADDEVIRDVFRRTRLLAEWLRERVPGVGLFQLSMGMTDDFELAIDEGATHVRIGRALFGQRN